MTPEAERFLAKARQTLEHGEAILGIGLGEEAARTAYLAAFHAAQALIYERTGREAKTHRGVHGQFALLSKDEASLPADLRRFLAQAYDLKAVADYATGAGGDGSSLLSSSWSSCRAAPREVARGAAPDQPATRVVGSPAANAAM